MLAERFKAVIYITAFTLVQFISSAFAVPANVSGDESVALLKGAIEGIWSYDIVVRVSSKKLFKVAGGRTPSPSRVGVVPVLVPLDKNELPPIDVKIYRQVMARDGKLRVEKIDESGQTLQTTVINGEKSVYYDAQKNSGVIRSDVLRGPLSDGQAYDMICRGALSGIPLVQLLRERVGKLTVQNETDKLVLDGPPVPELGAAASIGNSGVRAAMKLSRGMMPDLFELYSLEGNDEIVEKRCVVSDFLQLPDGAWVPISATTTLFAVTPAFKDMEIYGSKFQEITLEVDVEQSKWNVELPSDTFEVEFPVGTNITDLTRGTVFITGQRGIGDNIDDLVRSAKEIIPSKIEGVDIIAHSTPASSSRKWLITANVGLLLILAFLWFFRRWKAANP